jgi:DTW domain-containing protein YfiP
VTHRRNKLKPRCLGCGLTPGTCICDALPRLRFATPIAIVQHVRENFKPTNTGRLLARMVEGTVVLPCGMREPPFDPKPLEDPSIDWRLLFPRDGAPVLNAGLPRADGRRLGFVLLDGSWSQCAHISRRLPVIAQLPCVALPEGPPSFWTVRTQHNERGRSTFEAALHALQLAEGAAAVSPLRQAFAEVTARLLHLKGKLRTPEIPTTWRV